AEQELRAIAQLDGVDPWAEIASASNRERALYLPYIFIENGAGFSSALFRNARSLLRGGDERLKPNKDRLREFSETELPLLQRDLYARGSGFSLIFVKKKQLFFFFLILSTL